MKKRILFICTHNSARSQMAEGLLSTLYGEQYEVNSAGTQPTTINPYAVKVMAEIGIDISKQSSKGLEKFMGMDFDYIVTVCDNAKEACPVFPGGKKYIHQSFEDPSKYIGNEHDTMEVFRRVRNEIIGWIKITFGGGG